MRKTYDGENRIFLLILILLAFAGFIIAFAVYSGNTNATISQLQQQNQHLIASQASLQTNVVMLTMHSVALTTRYIQNGTCIMGFLKRHRFGFNVDEFQDYVYLNYSLKEIYLNNTSVGVPFTVLEISASPRPVVYNGWEDVPVDGMNQPDNSFHALTLTMQFFNPPISHLDVLSDQAVYLPYSYVTASKIKLSPDCISSKNCTNEHGRSIYRDGAFLPNSIRLFPLGNRPFYGNYTVMLFYWDDPNNIREANPSGFGGGPFYNFSGTSIEFTDKIELLLTN